MTDHEKREIIERLACQCYADDEFYDDIYVYHPDWGTLSDVDKEPYIQQAEYWTRLLRYFELREQRELLGELANSPITFTGPKFVEMQVPRAAVEEALDILGGAGA